MKAQGHTLYSVASSKKTAPGSLDLLKPLGSFLKETEGTELPGSIVDFARATDLLIGEYFKCSESLLKDYLNQVSLDCKDFMMQLLDWRMRQDFPLIVEK
jgi:hypothetical protein